MKFGGTSVESYEAIERVTGIVKKASRRPIVVVSAMGKTTNKLLNLAIEAAGGRRDQALSIVDDIRAHHLTAGLALAGAAAADLDRHIRSHFEWLENWSKASPLWENCRRDQWTRCYVWLTVVLLDRQHWTPLHAAPICTPRRGSYRAFADMNADFATATARCR